MKRLWLLAWLAVVSLAGAWLLGPVIVEAQEAAKSATEKASTKDADVDSAKGEEKGPKFIRIRRNDKGKPLAMETAVVRYVSPDRPGVEVDLVGAIHIGDKPYYEELNKLFESYEVVLYE